MLIPDDERKIKIEGNLVMQTPHRIVSISMATAAVVACPALAGAIKDAMDEEEKQAREQLRNGIESGSVTLLNDTEDVDLKKELESFSFEVHKKSNSKEGRLPRKLRNGW